MAENDESVEEPQLEEDSTAVEGDSEEKKIAGLSVSLIIKIAIGLVVVLLAAGIYFFFSDDKPVAEGEEIMEPEKMEMEEEPEVESAISKRLKAVSMGVKNEQEQEADAIPEDMMLEEEMAVMKEETEVMKEEGSEVDAPNEAALLKKQIEDLKAQIERKNRIMEEREDALNSGLAVEEYLTGSTDELRGGLTIPDSNSESTLEPSWGEFDRYKYQKK